MMPFFGPFRILGLLENRDGVNSTLPPLRHLLICQKEKGKKAFEREVTFDTVDWNDLRGLQRGFGGL